MAIYQVLYWQQIPAQIKVFTDKRPLSAQLPQDFQEKIDQVAMMQGLLGTDAYLEQWQWSEKKEMDGSPEEVRDKLLTVFEAEFHNY